MLRCMIYVVWPAVRSILEVPFPRLRNAGMLCMIDVNSVVVFCSAARGHDGEPLPRAETCRDRHATLQPVDPYGGRHPRVLPRGHFHFG
eukprot:COSAG02_NODE_43296_length_376_cov_0.703971_1_plen_88_part_01